MISCQALCLQKTQWWWSKDCHHHLLISDRREWKYVHYGDDFSVLEYFGTWLVIFSCLKIQVGKDIAGEFLKKSHLAMWLWKRRILNLDSHDVNIVIHFIWHSWLLFWKNNASPGIGLCCIYRERDNST